jgi:hypothetical protein
MLLGARGASGEQLRKGETYELPDPLALMLVRAGRAEEAKAAVEEPDDQDSEPRRKATRKGARK